MNKRPIHVLALAMLTIPWAPSAVAEAEYAAFFIKNSTMDQEFFVGLTTFDLQLEHASQQPDRHIKDVETYYDPAGVLRHDVTFSGGSNPTSVLTEQTQAEVVAAAAAYAANNLYISDLSSALGADGVRRYTVVFRWELGPYATFFGQTKSEFSATRQEQGNAGNWPAVMEITIDSDGVKRFDSVFKVDSIQPWYHATDRSEADFQVLVQQQSNAGREVAYVEQYRNKNGVVKYAALFVTDSTNRMHALGLTKAELDVLIFVNEGVGFELVDVASLQGVGSGEQPSWDNDQHGLAGTNGVPELTLSALPYLGQTIDLNIGNSSGAPAPCLFLMGLEQADLPFAGGSIWFDPITSFAFQLPAGGASLPVALPSDVTLTGIKVRCQAAQADAGAPEGISLSQQLIVVLGRLE